MCGRVSGAAAAGRCCAISALLLDAETVASTASPSAPPIWAVVFTRPEARPVPCGVEPERSRSADRMMPHPAGRDDRVISSQVSAHDGARRINWRTPSAWEERSS
jgi:hypothetical protein